MRRYMVSLVWVWLLATTLQAQGPTGGQDALRQAAAEGKIAFVMFWKDRSVQTDQAWSALQSATRNLGAAVDVVAVGIQDPAERELVTRFDLTRAPMPLVMAIAPCGAITKAFTQTSQLTEDQLRAALVSPCTQLSLKALQDQKLVLLCVLDLKDASQPVTVPVGVRDFKADGRFGPATEVVLVNANDQREAGFLKELQVDSRTPKPFTLLMAPPGSVLGTFDARATKEQMVAQLAAAASNPCADGKCGPNGCAPRK